jgi:hypothetical protein
MYLLHLTYASGLRRTLTFPCAFTRGLFLIAIAEWPVVLQLDDPAVAA